MQGAFPRVFDLPNRVIHDAVWWLDALLERWEAPHVITVQLPTKTPRAAWSSEQLPLAGRMGVR
jgi:hypothetical protein